MHAARACAAFPSVRAIYLSQRLAHKRSKHRAQAAKALTAAPLRAKAWKPRRKMIADLVVDLTDRSSLFDDSEQVDREHFFVGEVRIGVARLALGKSPEAALPVVSADEQVNANKRIRKVHVAKGGVCEKASGTFFKPPAATWFFNP